MKDEIKTEDIIKSLRVCNETECEGCKFVPFGPGQCVYNLLRAAAERLEQLEENRRNDMPEGRNIMIDIKQMLKMAATVPIAEYNGRKLYVGNWHHFKGNDYFVIGIAVHTETDETLVLYKDSLVNSKQYARPLSMFMSEVDREKYPDAPQKYRFERKDSRNE